ncbi:MAG: hypothetical protein IJ468_07375 [Lachnospiraceae bacterium]|nr:hypothetical protein [Lachnospiraceae bacterium]
MVLSKIADGLNKADITWSIGASLLLYLKGITDRFNDIDIMVTEKDVFRLKETLLSLGTMNPPNPNRQYRTRHFYEFVVDGIDIDVMAGFVIVDDDREYDCSLHENQIIEYQVVNDATIPLQLVALWREYYRLMHREKKVAMIDQAIL